MLISLYFRASYPKRFWGTSEKNYCIRLGKRRLFFSFFANLSLFLVFSVLSVGEKIFGQAFFTSSVLLQGLVCNETWHGSKMEQSPSAESYGINTRSQAQLCWHLRKSDKIIRLALTALACIEGLYTYLRPTAEMTQLRGVPKLNDTNALHVCVRTTCRSP